MVSFLTFIEIIVSVLLVVVVLAQPKESGLGVALTGVSEASFERRGGARTLHNITVVLAIIFVLTSIALFFIA